MKKIQLIAIALLISGATVAQNGPVDFETGGNGAAWSWNTFENDDNPALEIVANPSSTGINTSSTVAKFTARQTGNPWAGCESMHGSDIGNYKIDATNSTITIMVYKSVASDVGIKLVTSTGWSKGELKVANTLTNQWEELTFDFSGVDHEDMTYDQIVVFMDFNARAAETVNYFDNITFKAGGGGSGEDVPMVAAPNPTLPEADVISLFSGVYTDVPVTTWRTDWSSATLSDIEIETNPTKKYSSLDFVGIETTGANSLDVTEMNYFNLDVWTPNSTTLKVKLVDFGTDNAFGGGDDVEHEVVFDNPTQKEWDVKNIALSDFTGLTTKSNISQIVLVSAPAGSSTLYVDNVYFSKAKVSSVNTQSVVSFRAYPNPTTGMVTLPTNTKSYSVTNLAGQQVMTGNLNVLNLGNLVTGIYTINAKLQDGTTAFCKVSKL
jgi:hypothetical protein